MLTRSIRNWWLSLAGHSQPAVESPLAVQRTVYKPSAWFCAGWKFVCADDRAALARTLETSIASLQDPVEHTCLQAGLSLVHGEVQAAAATASIAIVARADFPFAYVLRARALRAQGMHSAALAEFKRAGELIPDDAQTLVEQAQEHLALGETADARDCYYLALAHAPDHPAALLGFARMLGESGDSRAALEQIRHAAHVAPLDAEIQFESALLHRRCDNLAGAVAAYERGLNLAPNDFAACTNLGLLYLSRLGDPRSAQRYLERAVALAPASVEAQANYGLALEEQGKVEAALAHYEQLIATYPAENDYRWNRGLALLAGGDFARGWADYEMRTELGRGKPPRKFPFPAWDGQNLRPGAALLVYGEQGIGDEIMFASCVPDVIARGIDCVIECDLRLAGLFERSFSDVRVHGSPRDGDRRWLDEYPEIDVQCAIGSLPQFLRRSAPDFTARAGYLCADPQRIARWRQRLTGEKAGCNIGIAWRGGGASTRGDLRSMAPRELAPLFDVAGVNFINFQRDAGDALADIRAQSGARLLYFEEALSDVEEMAALLQVMDCIITVDNSVAHLAGALGCKTWILLSHSADWRWLRTQSTSPWYPSVTLWRQPVPGDWASVIEQVRVGLNASAENAGQYLPMATQTQKNKSC